MRQHDHATWYIFLTSIAACIVILLVTDSSLRGGLIGEPKDQPVDVRMCVCAYEPDPEC